MIYPGEANEELKRLRGVEKDPKHLKLKAQIARLSHSTAEDHHRFAALVAEADALRSAEADALRAAEEMEVANDDLIQERARIIASHGKQWGRIQQLQHTNEALGNDNKELKRFVDDYIGEDEDSYIERQSRQIAKLEQALEKKKSTAKSRLKALDKLRLDFAKVKNESIADQEKHRKQQEDLCSAQLAIREHLQSQLSSAEQSLSQQVANLNKLDKKLRSEMALENDARVKWVNSALAREKALEAQLAGLKQLELRNPNGTIKLIFRQMYIDLLGNGIPSTRVHSALSTILGAVGMEKIDKDPSKKWILGLQQEGLWLCKMHVALTWMDQTKRGNCVGISQDSTTSRLQEWGAYVATFKGEDGEDKFNDMIMSDSLLISHGSQDTLDEFNHLIGEYQECLSRLGLGDGTTLCSTAHVGAGMSDRADAARAFNRLLQTDIRVKAPTVIPGWNEMTAEEQLHRTELLEATCGIHKGVNLGVNFAKTLANHGV